jgi:metal-responsive CopG/Arc/MetJ family transcriptional regulator
MAARSSSSSKVKVTATLDADLVKAIDDFLSTSQAQSRSQFIEKILAQWHRNLKKRELEKQVEDYYLSMSDEEKREDREWDKISSDSSVHLWED